MTDSGDIIIRKCFPEEIDEVVELWIEVSIQAHDFIPPEFWNRNKTRMALDYLPAAETFVAIKDEKIVGFTSIVEDYLAAIFVRSSMQGKGIGSMLLKETRKKKHSLSLKVYKKNRKSIEFYINQGFVIKSEEVDKDTGEKEYLMVWRSSQTDSGAENNFIVPA